MNFSLQLYKKVPILFLEIRKEMRMDTGKDCGCSHGDPKKTEPPVKENHPTEKHPDKEDVTQKKDANPTPHDITDAYYDTTGECS
jgi:hypothetical protein